MPGIDIVLRTQRLKEGVDAVKRGFGTIKDSGQKALEAMERSSLRLNSTLFSLKTALAALAVGEFTREMITLSISLERAERNLRGVMVSAQDARLQLARLQDLGDKFQLLPDADLADAYRRLVSFGIPQAEEAMETIANVAVITGNSVAAVTNAVITGNERMLKQVGVELIDLGQGEVDLIFNNMEIRVKKTEDRIRSGLLTLLKKGYPDAAKEMGDKLEFQFKRVGDSYERLQQAIMEEGGLKHFFTTTAKLIADTFSDEKTIAKGRLIGRAIVETLIFIGQAAALTADALSPVYRTLERLYDLLDRMGVFSEKFAVSSRDNLLLSPGALGLITKEVYEARTKQFNKLKQSEEAKRLLEDPLNLENAGAARVEVEKSYSRSFNEFVSQFRKDWEKADKELEQMKKDKAAGKKGATAGTGKNASERIMEAQIGQLAKDTTRIIGEENKKRDILYNPERAEAYAMALDYIKAKELSGLDVTDKQVAKIKALFAAQGEARLSTRLWSEELDINNAAIARRTAFLAASEEQLRAANDAEVALSQPKGAARRTEEVRLQMIRDIERDRIPINENVLKVIMRIPEALAAQERTNETLLDQERKREDHLERMAALQDEINDLKRKSLQGGESIDTQVNRASRQALRDNVDFDEEVERARRISEHNKAREKALAGVNRELDKQIAADEHAISIAGSMRHQREAELAFYEEKIRLLEEGYRLNEREEAQLKRKYQEAQGFKRLREGAEAFNTFVDSFEVGWAEIERGGEQAFSHLEDALTNWIMTGKMDFEDFANFVTSELIKMGIRASISQIMGGSGGGGLMGLFGSAVGAYATGAGGGGAAAVTAGTSGPMTSSIGMAPLGSVWGYRHGGVFDYSGRAFKSYYDVPGAQSGMVSYNERLLRISEGHTAEAVIPLKGGKVPVQVQGGRAMTINAPITIITPDSTGVRRSDTQIQAQLSSSLTRAARRVL